MLPGVPTQLRHCATVPQQCKEFTEASVSGVSSQEHQLEKSDAMNTFDLLRVCSSSLNLSPITTMKLAQSVYTRGCISYPRTETTAYPNSFDFAAALHVRPFAVHAEKGAGKVERRLRACAQIYCPTLLATLMRPCNYLTKTVKFDIGGEQFQFQCRVVTDPGFTTVLNWLAVAQTRRWLTMFSLLSSELRSKSLMEQCGIGTDGSIPTHIHTICVRKYVTVEQNRQLVPTKLGISLIHGYRRVDLDQTLLSLRVNVERQMDLIVNGKADYATIKQ
ncbi:hypothetical protein GPALN_012310 [Globodera pallida]|nr:hypothetical protein GPALN_012310 [Globodera pallida]